MYVFELSVLQSGAYGGPVVGASTAPGSAPYQLPYQPPGGYYAPPSVGFPVPSGYVTPGGSYEQPHPAMVVRIRS